MGSRHHLDALDRKCAAVPGDSHLAGVRGLAADVDRDRSHRGLGDRTAAATSDTAAPIVPVSGRSAFCLYTVFVTYLYRIGAGLDGKPLAVMVIRYFRETLDSRLCNLHSNSDRGRPDWRTIDNSVPVRNSL